MNIDSRDERAPVEAPVIRDVNGDEWVELFPFVAVPISKAIGWRWSDTRTVGVRSMDRESDPVVVRARDFFEKPRMVQSEMSRQDIEDLYLIASYTCRRLPEIASGRFHDNSNNISKLIGIAMFYDVLDQDQIPMVRRVLTLQRNVERYIEAFESGPDPRPMSDEASNTLLNAAWLAHFVGNWANRYYRRVTTDDLKRWGVPVPVLALLNELSDVKDQGWQAAATRPLSDSAKVLLCALALDKMMVFPIPDDRALFVVNDDKWGTTDSPSASFPPRAQFKAIENAHPTPAMVKWIRDVMRDGPVVRSEFEEEVSVPRYPWHQIARAFPNESIAGGASFWIGNFRGYPEWRNECTGDASLVVALTCRLLLRHYVRDIQERNVISNIYAIAKGDFKERGSAFVQLEEHAPVRGFVTALANRAEYGLKTVADRFSGDSEAMHIESGRRDTLTSMDALTYLAVSTFFYVHMAHAGSVNQSRKPYFPELVDAMNGTFGYMPKTLAVRYYHNDFTPADRVVAGRLWADQRVQSFWGGNRRGLSFGDWCEALGSEGSSGVAQLIGNGFANSSLSIEQIERIADSWKVCIGAVGHAALHSAEPVEIFLGYGGGGSTTISGSFVDGRLELRFESDDSLYAFDVFTQLAAAGYRGLDTNIATEDIPWPMVDEPIKFTAKWSVKPETNWYADSGAGCAKALDEFAEAVRMEVLDAPQRFLNQGSRVVIFAFKEKQERNHFVGDVLELFADDSGAAFTVVSSRQELRGD